jgi:hypothetical protein
MENKKSIIQTEREAELFTKIGEVLEAYETGDTILVVRVRNLEDEEGNYRNHVATGIISEHLPILKRTFERIIRHGMDTVAKKDPVAAAHLIAQIMRNEQEEN